jgi:hypothetical protein
MITRLGAPPVCPKTGVAAALATRLADAATNVRRVTEEMWDSSLIFPSRKARVHHSARKAGGKFHRFALA